MCGIVGIIYDDKDRPVDEGVLEAMNRHLLHRGPDDEGYYFSSGVGLAMRRLAIMDPEHGKQPCKNEVGNIVSVCNGEL